MVGYLLLGTARLSPGKIGVQAQGLPRTTRLKNNMKKPPGPQRDRRLRGLNAFDRLGPWRALLMK
jgi:hypothetical protein